MSESIEAEAQQTSTPDAHNLDDTEIYNQFITTDIRQDHVILIDKSLLNL